MFGLFDAGALQRDTGCDRPHGGKDLATDLPDIVTGAEGLGPFRAGQRLSESIDCLAAHGASLPHVQHHFY